MPDLRRIVPVCFLCWFLAAGLPGPVLGTEPDGASSQPFGPEPAVDGGPGPNRPAEERAGWDRWERVARKPLPDKTRSVLLPVRWAIRFFQEVVSPVDGPSCDFTPSCSAYGLEAVRKHGVLGIPMATERIVRNHRPDNPIRYPLVEREGDLYYLDPVESNDFWWVSDP
jgi:putative component of membrane protein insertase Oxa1/YidC/SpoIIIJ protein YidD